MKQVVTVEMDENEEAVVVERAVALTPEETAQRVEDFKLHQVLFRNHLKSINKEHAGRLIQNIASVQEQIDALRSVNGALDPIFAQIDAIHAKAAVIEEYINNTDFETLQAFTTKEAWK